MRSFLAALQFLTILPVRGAFDERALGRSISWFPAVGLIVGVLAACADAAGLHLGCPRAVMNVASVAMLAALTGGLHLDGLADTADGFLSARPRQRVLEIMRDSRIGTMGVLALVLVLAFKTAGLSQLQGTLRPRALLLAPVAGRCLQVLTIGLLPYAHPTGGLARVFVEARRPVPHCLWAAFCLVGTALALFGSRGLGIALACGALLAIMAWRSRRRIGGFTGDTLGASSEIAEAVVIVCASLLSPGSAQ
jgi:adenosylcobinamide-GDP ribazoletransferase